MESDAVLARRRRRHGDGLLAVSTRCCGTTPASAVLYLNNGKWGNEQVVPAAWVKASVTPDAPHLMPGKRDHSHDWILGYGYQWWIPENPDGDFLAIGIYGQFIYIYPKYRVVIAKTSAYVDYNKDGDDMEIETIEMFRAIARQVR